MQQKAPHFQQKSSKCKDQKSLAAHLEGSHSTLLCHDTTVEKHLYSSQQYIIEIEIEVTHRKGI